MPIEGAGVGGIGPAAGCPILPGATAYVGFDACKAPHTNYWFCDGVADEVQINLAIVYVSGLGAGEVHLERGVYTLAASVTPLSNVNLSGEGWGTILDGTTVCHALDINAQTYILCENFAVRTTAGGLAAFNGVNIRGGSSYLLFTQFAVLASDQDGIAITNADSDIWVDTTSIGNIDRYGVNCDGDDCIFREIDFHTAMGNDAIWLGPNSDGCDVSQNHIHVWTGEPVDDDGDNNSRFNLCTAVGIPVVAWNSKGCGFATIQAAIDHQAGGGSVTIEAGTHAVAAGVISLDAADNNLEICGAGFLVTNLTSVAATGPCIDINACINVHITHLSVATTGVGANDSIQIRGASAAIHLEEIACLDCGQDVVSIAAASSNVHIHDCYFFANITRYGINNTGDDCMISDNRINGTGNDGIYLQGGGTNNMVCLNRISGWTNEAIDNDDLSNTVSHNNTQV